MTRISNLIQVAIATGREPSDVCHFAQLLGLNGPQISDNGAMILDPLSGTPIWNSPLGSHLTAKIIEGLHESAGNFMGTHPGGTVNSLADASGINLTRVSVLDLDEVTADFMVADFAGIINADVVKAYLPYNDLWAVDFTGKGVNKGLGARQLSRMVGADPSQIVAAGDSYNDLPLFKVAGTCIAMETAPDELKDMADFIAPSAKEDGLAIAIDDFLLPPLR